MHDGPVIKLAVLYIKTRIAFQTSRMLLNLLYDTRQNVYKFNCKIKHIKCNLFEYRDYC